MGKTGAQLLFVSLLLSVCTCLVAAQSGRAQREKPNNPGVSGPDPSSTRDAVTTTKGSAGKDAGRIPLLVMLSRQRRLVMLPASNEAHAERIAKSLGLDARLAVRFDPQKIKLEDAQKMLSAGRRTYLLLVRFEEFDDRDNSNSCGSDSGGARSFKMDYTLLDPEARALPKKRSIQTFFSCARDVKPLPGPFVTNCLNRSRDALDEAAVQCMTRLVLTDLYNFPRPGEPTKH